MLTTFALAGGALSTGYLLFAHRFKTKPTKESSVPTGLIEAEPIETKPIGAKPSTWLVTIRNQWAKLLPAQKKEHNEVEEDLLEYEFDMEQQIALSNRGLLSSVVSLGFATVGAFIYAPISYLVIPTLTYLGIPPAQRATQALFEERRASTSLLELGVIIVCIVQGYYMIGSIGFCAYYLIRVLSHQSQQKRENLLAAWQTPSVVRLQSDEKEKEVPAYTIQSGDTIVVQTGEMVPIDGTIIDGTAWINRRGNGVKENPIIQTVGHQVNATDIVLVGQISIEI